MQKNKVFGAVVLLIMTTLSLFAQQTNDKISQFHQQLLTLDSHTDTPLRLSRSNFDNWNKK